MTTQEIRSQVLPILQAAGVTRSALFGSYVRGEDRKDSDVDILVELPRGKSLLDLIRLERELATKLGKKVDVVTFKSISPLLKHSIEEDAVSIL